MNGFSYVRLAQNPENPTRKMEAQTYHRQINVADHLHDTRYLICCNEASALTFSDNLIRHFVLLGLEDRGLVKANGRCVDAHIRKYDINIIHATRETKVVRQ